MKHLFPSAALSLFLFGLWLCLNGTLSLAQALLGAGLAVAIPWWTERLRPDKARFKRPARMLRLLLRVLKDILVANLQVSKAILGPESALRPRFVRISLDISDQNAVTALLAIISLTPGTVSADLSGDRRELLVHALHAPDEEALIADIKLRYESPLKEIFE